jgi:7,8-dihydropterin-6-yl-methyl-4-(beta-D-ribofuranosyl)aminobenzene 5'-phosphate synthase
MTILLRLLLILCALIMTAPAPARAEVSVTILYDAFGAHSAMTPDWGFSALVEYRGQRILFDAGNDPETLARNLGATGGDLATVEFAPGLHLIANHGHWGVDLDVKELSLAVETENGPVLIVGCSHPTIETIVRTAAEATGRPVDMIVGGLHLLPADHDEIRRVSESLRDEWRVRRIAPGHCTGEHALAIIRDVFGADFIEAGLGSSIVR